MGKLVRALSEDGSILCSALDSTDIVREIAALHDSSPVVTAALGRLSTACSIMGAMQKSEDDSLTLRINGGGMCGTLTAVSDYKGNVKCCAGNPQADLPARPDGRLDVAGMVGADGFLTVIKDMGLKEPYCGQIPLTSGNIAEDITAYYTISEQLPTVMVLGIVFGENAKIEAAGGFMVQLVPPVKEDAPDIIEKNLTKMPPITDLLQAGFTPEKIALDALAGLGAEILDQWDAVYRCGCSREKTAGILMSLGDKEIRRLAEEQPETEVCCHFCNKRYRFSSDEMLKLLKE